MLGHKLSLDTEEVLRLAASGGVAPARRGFASHLQEVEADSFAGSFLLPIWLVTRHARRQGWSREALRGEDVVYQLALRCGASFQSTVRALERHGFVTALDARRLLNVKPKVVKARLGHRSPAADPWSDAWRLTPADCGLDMELVVGDTVALDLTPDDLRDEWSVDLRGDARAPVPEASPLEPPRPRPFRAAEPGVAALRLASDFDGNHGVRAFSLTVVPRERGLSRANRARMVRDADGSERRDAA